MLVPCYNEEAAVAKVVADFRAALPARGGLSSTTIIRPTRPSRSARAAGADRAPRNPPGQGPRGAAHVHRRRSRHLRAGGWRRHLRRAERARPWSSSCSPSGSTWWWRRASTAKRRPIAPATAPATVCLPAFVASRVRPVASPTCCRATGCSRAASSNRFRCCRVASRSRPSSPSMRSSWSCRSAEIDTPYYSRPAGLSLEAQHLARRLPHPATMLRLYRAERPLSLFGAIGIALADRVGRPRGPDFHHLRAGRTGAALADRRLVDRPDAACVPVDCGRPHPRHRDARPPRAQASGLSCACARRAKSGGGAGTCASSCVPTMRC